MYSSNIVLLATYHDKPLQHDFQGSSMYDVTIMGGQGFCDDNALVLEGEKMGEGGLKLSKSVERHLWMNL